MADAERTRRSLRVLVVDDSPLVRQTLAALLQSEPGIDVVLAPDPIFAQQKIERERPHVIVLDLEMPRMDGLTFLERQMRSDPIPVVICAALGGPSEAKAMRALELGAVHVIAKPRMGVKDFLHDAATEIVDAVREAAESRRVRAWAAPVSAPRAPAPALQYGKRVVAIGASAGGTEALRAILTSMPAHVPPILIVQHMPEGFTAAFARQLDQTCAMRVVEAVHGTMVEPGHAYVAPGNRHMIVRRAGGELQIQVHDGPLHSRHRPSVDALFESVAMHAGANAIGVLLTGMGDDGVQGLAAMKARGAVTLAQDEATCVVYGMPREAVRRGCVDRVVPLPQMARAILSSSAEPV